MLLSKKNKLYINYVCKHMNHIYLFIKVYIPNEQTGGYRGKEKPLGGTRLKWDPSSFR